MPVSFPKVRVSVEKTVARLGESIAVEGCVEPPMYAPFQVLSDGEVLATGFTKPDGRYKAYVTMVKPGRVNVYARVLQSFSDTVTVLVEERPVTVTPPAVPGAPAVPPQTLWEMSREDFAKLLSGTVRDVLRELYGVFPDYRFWSGEVPANGCKDFDIIKELGREARAGYLANDHSTDSLWVSLNDYDYVEVKGGETYDLGGRAVRRIRIANRGTAPVPYRLEVR